MTWLLGADPFIQQAERSNEIYALNGGRIKLELGSFDEVHEENLIYILGPNNTLDDRCAGTPAGGNLRLSNAVRQLIDDHPRNQNRITLYYVPLMATGADGLTLHSTTCGGDPAAAGAPFIVLATEPGKLLVDTLAHELVHALADLRDLTDPALSSRLLYGYGASRTGHVLSKDEIKKIRTSPYPSP